MELLQLSGSMEQNQSRGLAQSVLSLLDITSSKGFAQGWKSLKVGEGQAEWGSGRQEGVELLPARP